jgi:archaellum component FlaC
MGASGAGGAYLYNHSDLFDAMMQDGARGVVHSLSTPASRGGSADVAQLTNVVQSLSNQVDMLARHQQNSHSVIVQSSQPSALFGVPLWKIVGLAGTAGTIYMKMAGYEMRDLVYVSKKHFDTATAAIQEQYEQLEVNVEGVRSSLLARLGLVEGKVDATRDSINAKIDAEMAGVSGRMDDLSGNISQMDGRLQETGSRIDGIGRDVNSLRTDLAGIHSELGVLSPMQKDMEEFKEQSSRAQAVLSQEMGSIHCKIDQLSRTTATLHHGLEKQSQGIGLLCRFASQSSNSPELKGMFEEYKTVDSPKRRTLPRPHSESSVVRGQRRGLAAVTTSDSQERSVTTM